MQKRFTIQILAEEFGWAKVNLALMNKEHTRLFIRDNPSLIDSLLNILWLQQLEGKAKECFELLDLSIQYALICYLIDS